MYNISANNFFITEIGFSLAAGLLTADISMATRTDRNETWDY
jgi:hypothetical protein